MGLHPQNGRRPPPELRERLGGVRALLHLALRADEEGLAGGQDRRRFDSRRVALLGAEAGEEKDQEAEAYVR